MMKTYYYQVYGAETGQKEQTGAIMQEKQRRIMLICGILFCSRYGVDSRLPWAERILRREDAPYPAKAA